MTRIFLDTNIILDYLLEREGCEEAEQILALSQDSQYKLLLSSLSMSNIAYITRKVFQGDALYEQLALIRELVDVTTVDQHCVDDAISLREVDFEDTLQYVSAKRSNVQAIITRNKKHFPFQDTAILTPEEFLSLDNQ